MILVNFLLVTDLHKNSMFVAMFQGKVLIDTYIAWKTWQKYKV